VQWKAVIGNALSLIVDSGCIERPKTLMRQNVIIVVIIDFIYSLTYWLQCLLVNIVRHKGTVVLDRVDICTPKLLLSVTVRFVVFTQKATQHDTKNAHNAKQHITDM